MIKAAVVILLILHGTSGRPLFNVRSVRDSLPSFEDVAHLSLHRSSRAITYPAGFQFMYVGSNGQIVENTKPATGQWISVVGSPAASHRAMYTAALDISRMLRHSPSYVFTNMANRPNCGVGVFTAEEKLTIFPEMASYADTPQCRGRCDGSCAHSCTFDGRKYETLAGSGGERALIIEDNIMCTPHDAYSHHNNILVHEFAHTTMRFGLTDADRRKITAAYNNAKAHGLWTLSSYAMANEEEYFAEGAGAFFLVNLDRGTIGGMINCPGHTCSTEAEARNLLRTHDPQLFDILSHAFTNGQPDTASGLSVCPV